MEEKNDSWWKLEIKKFFLRLFLSVGTGIAAIIFVFIAFAVLMKACTVVMEKSLKEGNMNRMQNSRVIPKK